MLSSIREVVTPAEMLAIPAVITQAPRDRAGSHVARLILLIFHFQVPPKALSNPQTQKVLTDSGAGGAHLVLSARQGSQSLGCTPRHLVLAE